MNKFQFFTQKKNNTKIYFNIILPVLFCCSYLFISNISNSSVLESYSPLNLEISYNSHDFLIIIKNFVLFFCFLLGLLGFIVIYRKTRVINDMKIKIPFSFIMKQYIRLSSTFNMSQYFTNYNLNKLSSLNNSKVNNLPEIETPSEKILRIHSIALDAFATGAYLEAITQYEKLISLYRSQEMIDEANLFEQKVRDLKKKIEDREFIISSLNYLLFNETVIECSIPIIIQFYEKVILLSSQLNDFAAMETYQKELSQFKIIYLLR